jgi:hypothetical protein
MDRFELAVLRHSSINASRADTKPFGTRDRSKTLESFQSFKKHSCPQISGIQTWPAISCLCFFSLSLVHSSVLSFSLTVHPTAGGASLFASLGKSHSWVFSGLRGESIFILLLCSGSETWVFSGLHRVIHESVEWAMHCAWLIILIQTLLLKWRERGKRRKANNSVVWVESSAGQRREGWEEGGQKEQGEMKRGGEMGGGSEGHVNMFLYMVWGEGACLSFGVCVVALFNWLGQLRTNGS